MKVVLLTLMLAAPAYGSISYQLVVKNEVTSEVKTYEPPNDKRFIIPLFDMKDWGCMFMDEKSLSSDTNVKSRSVACLKEKSDYANFGVRVTCSKDFKFDVNRLELSGGQGKNNVSIVFKCEYH